MAKVKKTKRYRIIGLMSGTSMDGVDAAYLETDGIAVTAHGPWLTVPYTAEFRARLRTFIEAKPARTGSQAELALEKDLTDLHAAAVRRLIQEMQAMSIDLIGFHGHTIWHRPAEKLTWQMGDGARLASTLRIPVVFDFRSADVAAGGQGAPLLPIYHAALARGLEYPVVVLNIGGVANLTWIASAINTAVPDGLTGFDVGPGNGLIDDWMRRRAGRDMDEGGAMAAKGRVHEEIIEKFLKQPFFDAPPPKSLDRLDFSLKPIANLSPEDGAATLTAFTAAAAAKAIAVCPKPPRRVLVTGGGRHNATLMRELKKRLSMPVETVEKVGWEGDALEAQGFAYFAARNVEGLPITFPRTTGVAKPLPGGRLVQPA